MPSELVTNLKQLAESIMKKAEELDAAEAANNKTAIQSARGDVVSLAEDVKIEGLSPFTYLGLQMLGFHDSTAFSIASEFNLASLVPDDGISYEDLSKASGCPLDPLIRTVRLLILNRVFVETTPGHVGHSVCSKIWKDGNFASIVGHCTHDGFPAAAFTKDALRQFPDAQEPNQTGFSLALGKGQNFFEYLNAHPQEQKRFNTAMRMSTGFTSGLAVKDIYPWNNINLLVDIGGGEGHVTRDVAEAFPNLKVVVEDQKDACASGEGLRPKELADRFTFKIHDFFSAQPVKDADAYYMRHILHDWPDRYCIKILQAIIPAMKPGSKILVNESLVPPQGEMKPSDERFLRYKDFQMLVLLNAKERTLDDFIRLFKATDPRLEFRKVWSDPNDRSVNPIIEAEFTG